MESKLYREMVIYEPVTRATQGDYDNGLWFNIDEDKYKRIKAILEEDYVWLKYDHGNCLVVKKPKEEIALYEKIVNWKDYIDESSQINENMDVNFLHCLEDELQEIIEEDYGNSDFGCHLKAIKADIGNVLSFYKGKDKFATCLAAECLNKIKYVNINYKIVSKLRCVLYTTFKLLVHMFPLMKWFADEVEISFSSL